MQRSRISQSVSVESMERRVMMDASQLTVTIDSSTLPTAVSDHAPLTGKMSLTVSNNSGVAQKQRVEVGFLIANGALNVPCQKLRDPQGR